MLGLKLFHFDKRSPNQIRIIGREFYHRESYCIHSLTYRSFSMLKKMSNSVWIHENVLAHPEILQIPFHINLYIPLYVMYQKQPAKRWDLLLRGCCTWLKNIKSILGTERTSFVVSKYDYTWPFFTVFFGIGNHLHGMPQELYVRFARCCVLMCLDAGQFYLIHILHTMSQSYVWDSSFLVSVCLVYVLHHIIVRQNTCGLDMVVA